MSGFRVNGASLSMHQDRQWEAADPSMPLYDTKIGSDKDAATVKTLETFFEFVASAMYVSQISGLHLKSSICKWKSRQGCA